MFRYRKTLWMGLIIGLWAQPVLASPFCVQAQGIPAECYYDDAAQCRNRARELTGECVPNPAELKLLPGSGKYCMVDSSRTSLCIYADRSSCENDAMKNNAVCIEIPDNNIQQDPYRLDPDRKY